MHKFLPWHPIELFTALKKPEHQFVVFTRLCNIAGLYEWLTRFVTSGFCLTQVHTCSLLHLSLWEGSFTPPAPACFLWIKLHLHVNLCSAFVVTGCSARLVFVSDSPSSVVNKQLGSMTLDEEQGASSPFFLHLPLFLTFLHPLVFALCIPHWNILSSLKGPGSQMLSWKHHRSMDVL